MWIPNVDDETTLRRREPALRAGLHSAFAFSIFVGGKFYGVMEFFGREVRPRDERILEIVRTVGHQIGQFIARKQAEAALQEANDQLTVKAQQLSPLQRRARAVRLRRLARPAGAAAHGRQLHAAVLRRYGERLDGDAQEFMDFIVDGAARMKQLIEDLLAYSRVGTRGKEFQPTVVEPPLTERARQPARGDRGSSGAVVTHDPLPTVDADECAARAAVPEPDRQRAQVPRQRTAAHPRSAREDRPAAGHSASKDNGIGIEPQYFERIFMMFQRLHNKARIPGHRHRPRDLQEDRRAPRRPHLGRVRAGRRQRRSASRCPNMRRRRRNDAIEEHAPVEILLVEDNPGDVRLTQGGAQGGQGLQQPALGEGRRRGDGVPAPRRASTRTRRAPTSSCSTSTCRRRTAARCSRRSRTTRTCKHIPVVVLTTSKAEEDVLRSYNLHANCYVTKPVDLEQFIVVVQVDRRLLAHRRDAAAERTVKSEATSAHGPPDRGQPGRRAPDPRDAGGGARRSRSSSRARTACARPRAAFAQAASAWCCSTCRCPTATGSRPSPRSTRTRRRCRSSCSPATTTSTLALVGGEERRAGLPGQGQLDRELLLRSMHYSIERKRYQVQLEHQANYDALTGLPNRTC